ncbi:zinc ribbon domain-containing protein [Anaerovorax odorimutans]|uniref:zinc ribbon domain-containing protein n=1 Tax=Anaerovorax odorimutans TaxID=109327 RepID=UPI00041469BF|nr:zinc ribbon domain-containing protein [Anaerovorax odorimutans]
MNYFKGMIKCSCCGKNYNFKNNNNQYEYICQTRKNYGKSKCNSQIVKEEFLVNIISQHCNILDKDFTMGKLKLFVRFIEVDDNDILIYYKDGTVSKVTPNKIVF